MVALLVFAIGLGATLYYWQNLNRSVQTNMNAAYTKQTDAIAAAIGSRLQSYEEFLRGSSGLVAIHPELTQAEWETYHRPYEFSKTYPDVRGAGVVRYLHPDDIPAYMELRESKGDENFAIFPAGAREIYAPVTFDIRYGVQADARIRGFDAYTDPVRRAAMEQALRSEHMVMSGKTHLVGEPQKDRSSFVLYVPVYKPGALTDTLEQRRAAIRGFAYLTIDSATFIRAVLTSAQTPHVGVQLYDDEQESQKPAYESENFAAIINQTGSKSSRETHELYGHRWQMRFAASPELVSPRERQLPSQALWRGIVTCIFFAGLVWYLITDRERTYARQKHEEVQTAKDDLLSLASHQLRTPATVVKQYVGMLLQGYAGSLSKQQLDMLGNAYESNERQLEIINQLLYVARLDAGRITLHTKKTDLTKLVHDVAHDQSGTLSERSQRLRFKLPKQPVSAEVDPHYMRMVLDNLLSNAVKYTPEKGLITLELRRLAGWITLRIKDTGVGIEPDAQMSIFEKFTRAENELSTDVNGSGVGLYLTKEIVELHHGTIEVQSEVGQGSVFIIKIPSRQPERPPVDL